MPFAWTASALKELIVFLKTGKHQPLRSKEQRKATVRRANSFRLQETALLYFWKKEKSWRRVYLEEEAADKKAHLEEIHRRGHAGHIATRKAAAEEIYPVRDSEIEEVISECRVCDHKGKR
ncbi:MAG: uncharacterized protein A8A55_2589 [Amphiamblys sp. WSBS2006]|nr:MAG: uncharacterized protein A8A55_2589 [Amphiamblys sp. WSBS2006]